MVEIRSSAALLILVTIINLSVLKVISAPTKKTGEFSMVLLHNNDMHGRFEETERNSGTCQDKHKGVSCIGGFARTAHVIRDFRKKAKEGSIPPVLYLNAGDTYTGTAWFTIFTWNITTVLLNALKPDAMSLGNHEFDLTPTNLAEFLNHYSYPLLAANLDFTNEPSLSKINKSIVLDVSGRKVGIIGYLTPETKLLASVGKVTFTDEVGAIRKESEALRTQGVDIIIALGHSGYLMDQKIAKEVELVDVVIGGHTNTFLWNGKTPDLEMIEDPYPKIVTQASGRKVPVVQAYAYTKYLGVLNVTFNDKGELTHFAGQPILLDTSIPQDQDILDLLNIYRPAIDALNTEVVGTTRVILDGNSTVCRKRECNFGSFLADALVNYAAQQSTVKWTDAPIAYINGGGIRNTINATEKNGQVTRGDLLGVWPFSNTVCQVTLTGTELIKTIEQGVRSNGETSLGEFPQVSGLRITLDMTKPSLSRVVSVKARCGDCGVPVYEDVEPSKNYTLVTTSFVADGGDGYTIIQEKSKNRKVYDLSDVDIIAWYFKKYSPVYPEVQGRISFVSDNDHEDADSDKNSSTLPQVNYITLVLALIVGHGRSYI